MDPVPAGTEPGFTEFDVIINGTEDNVWLRWNLRHNPFPQESLARAEWAAAAQQIASLDGEPVRSPQDIRDRLKGFSPEFIEGCISRWQPGQRTQFTVRFPR